MLGPGSPLLLEHGTVAGSEQLCYTDTLTLTLYTYTLHFSLYTLAFTPGTRCGNSVTGCPLPSPRPATRTPEDEL